jgi:hypothetical protein
MVTYLECGIQVTLESGIHSENPDSGILKSFTIPENHEKCKNYTDNSSKILPNTSL